MMGSDKFYPEEKPVRRATVDGFHIDAYEVTNEDYKKFVEETHYIPVAERPLNPDEYPGINPEMLEQSVTWSVVMTPEPSSALLLAAGLLALRRRGATRGFRRP